MRRKEMIGVKISVLLLVIIPVLSCSTKGTVNSDPPAEVARLNANFATAEQLGSTPFRLMEEGNVGRYSLARKGRFPEYLILMYPQKLDGDLILKTENKGGQSNVTSAYRQYLDMLLRGHRHLIRGELAESKAILKVLQDNYDTTFGGLYLSGIIAMVEGDLSKAKREIQFAKSLYPGAKELQELEPK